MKLRVFLVSIMLLFAVVSVGFPDAFKISGAKTDIYADTEVGSTEELHGIMLYSIRDVRDSIRIRIADYDADKYNIDDALRRILAEDSESSFVSGCSATITTMHGKTSAVMEVKLQYQYTRDRVIAMRNETASKADEIIGALIKPEMSDYEKALAVHDYIIRSSRYDRLNADSGTVPPEEHEAYGVLVKGIGVCDSYAKAVKLLMEKSGVQSLIVEGRKVDEGIPGIADHAWNIVKLDGEYYHIDTTWDDVSEDKDSAGVIYHHFNISDEEMQKTHIWDKSKYPPSTGIKYNYYSYNRLTAKNQAEAMSKLAKAISDREKKFSVKIADYTRASYNIENMIKKAAEINRLRQGISAKWVINDSLGIIDVEFKY